LSEHKLNYAYHLDATAYGQYLRRLAEANGTRRIEGQIAHVSVSETTGFIDYLQLKDGQQIAGDLFIDCTGFRALLIEDALRTGFDDWSHWLPCNRAWAVQTELTGEPVPYTRAIAHDSGWRWRIPLQHRVGNGLVYCNDYLDDDAARERLLSLVDGTPIIDPRPIRFTTGQRRQYWNKNCIALGLSSGFIEPLESTSIHFIQNGIMWLLLMFPDSVMSQASVDEYNNKLRGEAERIRDFIVLHYFANQRTGEPFWDMCRDLPIPESLSQRMALFKETGRVFKPQDDVFSENSWVQVMMGQGLIPESYHNIVDSMSNEQLQQFLGDIQRDVERTVAALPNHGAFVEALVAHAR
ncbi:MAG: tryptophan halogenase family protein, partial [Halieaceae bacterium]